MPKAVDKFLNQELWDNDLSQWLIALAVVAAVTVVARIARGLAVRWWGQLAAKTATSLDDALVEVLQATRTWFFAALGVVAASFVLELPNQGGHYVRMVAVAISLLQAGIWGGLLVDRLIERHFRHEAEHEPARATGAAVLRILALVAVWSLVLLMFLANLGVDITALVAGLGIGGVALALALQNVLGDLFASVSILLDKPFEVGDFIKVDDKLGTIEKIGIKTVRIASLSGEQIVFSNNDLLTSRVHNFSRMRERRIAVRLGVVYQTPVEKMEKIPGMLQEIVENTEQVRFDRAHFATYGAYDLQFELVYFVLSPEFPVYMDAQQRINLEVMRQFAAEGIEFAYPTQTLYAPQVQSRAVPGERATG